MQVFWKNVFSFFVYEMQTRFSWNNGMFYEFGNIPVDLTIRGCSGICCCEGNYTSKLE